MRVVLNVLMIFISRFIRAYRYEWKGITLDSKNLYENTLFEELDYLKDIELYSQRYSNKLTVNRVFDEKYYHSMRHVTFLLPAYNEEQSIGPLVKNIRRYPKSKVIVVDNNSKDKTAYVAKKSGANVLKERKQGKAHAIKRGFENVKSDFIVMLDADNTYDPEDAQKLLKPLMDGKADVVLGSRLLGKREKGSISRFNLVGNRLLSFFASILFSKVSDVCTGYWAFQRKVIDSLLQEGIDSDGFDLEVEMFSKISNNNFRVLEIPINYKNRLDSPKLNGLNDGIKIFKRMLSYWIKTRRVRR
ncbi:MULTISPECIES: glycosyltransferase family 2 protein [Methanobacterium]|jgi:glycosyltransferase involved in cell wall biosynthesis|uniref:Glycosyltransferase family 2 protein n=1 Tax=Methanobacterium veterum TaxID=408577 RepID=A0A9E5DLP9_9EURY|nr:MULTISPECIES: glycosyltransferase family 2 protein [Methanobacterium]MCZ3373874.1 glycosyltransferase family 2 protein [Methanobacterium veterum]